MTDSIQHAPTALIYCRVSTKKQSESPAAHGLESQETRCRDYAEGKGYEVEAVFPDDVSGGGDFMKRPGMVALLSYLDAQPDKNYVVIFDDLKRFARDTEFHIRLRRAFKIRGAEVECLNFKFDDSPEGRFIETIIAAQGALEREQNSRQVSQKMKVRMQKGYWCFCPPQGYSFTLSKEHGKIMVPEQPLAGVLKEAMENYASGRFESQAEVKRFLDAQPCMPKHKARGVTIQRVTDILKNPLYAGYICNEGWNLHWVKARHEPLISLETFEKIQNRRMGKYKAPAKKNLNEDFVLRNFVECADCGSPLTACWSQGRNKKYPYYLCDRKGCPSHRKSIQRAKIEGAFEHVVKSLQPTQILIDIARAMLKQAFKIRLTQHQDHLVTLSSQSESIDRQIENLLERIVETESKTVISAYEKKIAKLEQEKRITNEKLAKYAQNSMSPEEYLEPALQFLSNPWNIWATGDYFLRRMVLRLAFSERIVYCREKGYRTAKTSLPFKVLEGFCASKSGLVGPPGLEPGTNGL